MHRRHVWIWPLFHNPVRGTVTGFSSTSMMSLYTLTRDVCYNSFSLQSSKFPFYFLGWPEKQNKIKQKQSKPKQNKTKQNKTKQNKTNTNQNKTKQNKSKTKQKQKKKKHLHVYACIE